MQEAFADDPNIVILTKQNAGKASALNYGIAHTTAEYVVCIDADTQLRKNAVTLLMRHYLTDTEGQNRSRCRECKGGKSA